MLSKVRAYDSSSVRVSLRAGQSPRKLRPDLRRWQRVLLYEQILKAFPAAFAEFGILIERAEVAFIGGWTYRQMDPVGVPPAGRGRPGPPPRWLLAILMRLHPAIRRRTSAARQALES